MPAMIQKKGRLPACVINERLLDELWRLFAAKGSFVWNAVVGTGGDLLGKDKERPRQVIHEWQALKEMLSSRPRIDQLQITVEYDSTTDETEPAGTISLVFKNFNPAGGLLIVAGHQEEWVNERLEAVLQLFAQVKDDFTTTLYNWYGSFFVFSVLPLMLSGIIVVVAAGLLIPGEIRRSEFVLWITAGTVIATLKVGQIISDRIIKYMVVRYPYLRWR